MNTVATFFLEATGEILRVNEMQDAVEILETLRAGEDWIAGEFNTKTHWVNNGSAEARPHVPEPTGAEYDLSQLPAGAELHVTDEEGFTTVIAAQNDTLQLTEAGTYRMYSVSPFPYLDFDVEVTV